MQVKLFKKKDKAKYKMVSSRHQNEVAALELSQRLMQQQITKLESLKN